MSVRPARRTPSASSLTVRRLVAGVVVLFVALGVWIPSAAAHTAFESSEPADRSTATAPVDAITITFTGEAEPAGDGFEVLAPGGVLLEPRVEVSSDGRVFTLLVDEPLAGGLVAVRWNVRAGDAHPIDGSFTFTTPAVVSNAMVAATPSPATDPDAPQSDAIGVGGEEVGDQPDTAPGDLAESTASVTETAAPEVVDLETFLDADGGLALTDVLSTIGFGLASTAGLIVVGVSTLVLVLSRDLLGVLRDHRGLVLVAAIVGVGALAEAAGLALDDVGQVLLGQAGIATLLRLVGALAAAGGALRRNDGLQLGGAACIVGSFVFDGHTVTEGNRLITAIADVVHVGAAAIWIGGVAVLVALRRSPSEDAFATFAGRFSVIAAASVTAVGVAGIALTVTIIDRASDLWTGAWGRSLLAKTAFVVIATALGALNHYVLVPAVERSEPGAVARFARAVRIELAVLVAVGALTAILVGRAV